jgi:transglutaminase-like putative cysteine protease
MIYDVRHTTTVRYASIVRLARFNLRLRPAPWPSQTLQDYALKIDPVPWTVQDEAGPYIVNRSRLTIKDPIAQLIIESRFRVEVRPPAMNFDSVPAPSVAEVRELALTRRDLSAASPASYLYASPAAAMVPEIGDWAKHFFDDGASVIAGGKALMAEIHAQFRYDSKATNSDTPPAEAFAQRRGVCQDFAHIMIIAARAQGIPAAYVSGYLRTLPPPGKPRLVGADATHAWANLWCGDDLGWVGFDPTNNAFAQTDHIFTAMGRDYSDVAPLDGVFHGGRGQTMTVAVDVEPVMEPAA